jgi:putative membrane protein
MKKIGAFAWGIFIFTLLYTLAFSFYFWNAGNLEFLWYIGILILIIVFVSLLHLRYKFSNGVLFGISLWGLLHMIGGTDITGVRTYARMIYPLVSSDIAGTAIFRYDQFMHFYVYVVVTVMLYQVIHYYI